MRPDKVPMQRAAGLAGAPALLAELGFDPRAACDGLSFSAETLVPDAYIPFSEALQLLANCARVSGHPHFGLLLGARCDHLCLGLVGELMQASPSLGEAVRLYIPAQIGLSRGATVYSYPVGQDVMLGFGIYARHHPGAAHAYDFTMAVAVNLVRALTGNRATVSEVLLCHRPPADPAAFEVILKAPVRFDQYQSCVVLPRADLRLPNPHADLDRQRSLMLQLAAALRIDPADPAAMLLHRMKPLLLQDACSLAAVAQRLEMHPRMLNRRLLEAGSSFLAIRDEVRARTAQKLLALTDLPVGEIASALSFSAHSNFVRAFRRWVGMTPSEWRSAALAHPPG